MVIEQSGPGQNGPNLSNPLHLKQEVEKLIAAGQSRMDAIKFAAKRAGLNKRAAYDLLEKEKS